MGQNQECMFSSWRNHHRKTTEVQQQMSKREGLGIISKTKESETKNKRLQGQDQKKRNEEGTE